MTNGDGLLLAAHSLRAHRKDAMGRRVNPRLTYSEYISPHAEESTALEMARRDLMDAIRRVYRPMLDRLLADVLTEYEQLAQSGFDFDEILWHPSPHARIPEGPLKSALERWAQEFNAQAGWFLDEILRTLRGWYVAPDWRVSLRSNPITTAPIVSDVGDLAMGERFCFEYKPWDPQWQPSKDYDRKLREEFEKKLSEYYAAGRQRAESHGLVLAPRQHSLIQMDWFVLYQFKGLSSTEIANLDPAEDSPDKAPDESTILKGVHRAADQLGWSGLRKVPRGHPKTVTKPRKSRS